MSGLDRLRFWRRWCVANGSGEMVGLGGVFVAGVFGAERLGEPRGAAAWALLALLVAALAVFEGAVVGIAQWVVLRRAIRELSMRSWTVATVVGAVIAWVLGMIPSSLASMGEPTDAPPPEPPQLVVLGLAAAMGAVLGVVLAAAQAWVLRRYVRRAALWLPANAAAWAVAMPIVFALVGATVAESQAPGSIALFVLGLGATGAVVGAVHGVVLVRLLLARRAG